MIRTRALLLVSGMAGLAVLAPLSPASDIAVDAVLAAVRKDHSLQGTFL